MLIFVVALGVALAVLGVLSLPRVARSPTWTATVTPLASIIGSGFLICGPLLAREFGGGAALAMAALLALAYALGAVVRYNIVHLEPLLGAIRFHDPVAWWARAGQAILAGAYAVSVAYYLKLLAEFSLKFIPLHAALHTLVSKAMVTLLILVFAGLAASGGHRRMEHLAHTTVSLKLGVIAGMLTALGLFWVMDWRAAVVIPPAHLGLRSVTLMLGLLVTVQGFETSRYLGASYAADLRVRSMRYAQWISSAIYIAFLLLLTPFLAQAAQAEGVAGILSIMGLVAPLLSVLVLVGAVASQLSAAVADSIGSAGLAAEVSRGRLSLTAGFLASAALAIAVTWLTDPLQVVAVASRSFALYYAVQCVLALLAERRTGGRRLLPQLAFVSLAGAAVAAAVAGAPAE